MTSPPAPRYRVYKRRWLLLIAASLLNLTNAFNWLTFAPIATFSAQFYNVSAADIDWFGNAFFIAGKCLLASEWVSSVNRHSLATGKVKWLK